MNALRYFTFPILVDSYQVDSAFIEDDRKNIICFPCQIGCSVRCSFCYSNPFVRDLGVEEISRIWESGVKYVNSEKPILYSCMGEGDISLNQHKEDILMEMSKFGRSALATVGMNLDLFSILSKCPSIKVTLSLHGTNDFMRRKLMNLNLPPIQEVMEAFRSYPGEKEINYLLIDRMNDSTEDLHRLLFLAGGIHVKFCIMNRPKLPVSKRIEDFAYTFGKLGGSYEVWKSDGEFVGSGCGLLTHHLERG